MRCLGNLKKLKNLRLNAQICVDKLIELLVENRIPIECLELNGNNNNLANAPAIDGLTKLTVHSVSDDILISLVRKHTKLTFLRVDGTQSNITLDGVKKVLELGRNLTKVLFSVSGLDIDLQNYESVLALVNNRIKLCILITHAGTVTVPSDVIEANFKWFELRIFNVRR